MPGLIVSLGGSSTGYEAMLEKSVGQAKVAGASIQSALARQTSGTGPNSAAAAIANEKRLAAAKVAIAKDSDLAILAANRLAGAQLTLAESLRLKNAGLEYRSLAAVAAEAEAEKVVSNRAAMDAIIRQEREEGIAYEVQQNMEVAAHAEAEAEKVAETKLAQEAMILAVAKGNGARAAIGSSAHGAGGLTGIIRESLVIIREVSMGRGLGRIGGSVTLLAQYLGVLKFAVKSTATEALLASGAASKLSQKMAVLALNAKGTSGEAYFAAQALKAESNAAKAATEANIALASASVKVNWAFMGWIALIVAAAAALYYLIEGMKAAKNSAKDLADHLAKSNDKFADGVEVLESHHQAMLRDAKAAAELTGWLDKLGKTTATTTDEMNEQLDAMKERFEFQKRIAEQNGASPQQIAAMEKKERDAELAVEKTALDKLKKDAEDAKQEGISATNNANEHAKLIDENKGKKDFDKTIEAVEYLDKRIPDDVKAKIKSNEAIIAAQKQREDNNEAYTIGQFSDSQAAKQENTKLKSTEYGKQSLLGIGDGKAIVSPDEVEGIYQQAMAKRALFFKQQEDLQRDQDALEKVTAQWMQAICLNRH